MNYIEKLHAVQSAAVGVSISGGELRKTYRYGENPFADMLIENALLCDMFPEEVENQTDHYGFNRFLYKINKQEATAS